MTHQDDDIMTEALEALDEGATIEQVTDAYPVDADALRRARIERARIERARASKARPAAPTADPTADPTRWQTLGELCDALRSRGAKVDSAQIAYRAKSDLAKWSRYQRVALDDAPIGAIVASVVADISRADYLYRRLDEDATEDEPEADETAPQRVADPVDGDSRDDLAAQLERELRELERQMTATEQRLQRMTDYADEQAARADTYQARMHRAEAALEGAVEQVKRTEAQRDDLVAELAALDTDEAEQLARVSGDLSRAEACLDRIIDARCAADFGELPPGFGDDYAEVAEEVEASFAIAALDVEEWRSRALTAESKLEDARLTLSAPGLAEAREMVGRLNAAAVAWVRDDDDAQLMTELVRVMALHQILGGGA